MVNARKSKKFKYRTFAYSFHADDCYTSLSYAWTNFKNGLHSDQKNMRYIG